MSFRKSRVNYLTAFNSRQLTSRIALGVLLFTSLLLMIMSQMNNQWVSRLRSSLVDVFVPVIAVASAPLDAVVRVGEWVGEMAAIRAQNIELKNTNIQLLQWQSIAKSLEAENNNLRSLMKVVSIPKSNYIATKLVTDVSGPYVRSALLGGGSEHGIKKDQAVINEYGLIGRVVETGSTSARVLLINDINSRIPVMLESSRQKAILVGNNSELPSLSYVVENELVQVGERLVTSGDGGVFPSGIAVGKVISVENGVVRVQPFVDATNLEYVNVVDYSL